MIKNESHIGIVVLAAGSSSRMGRSKQLLLIDGKPLLLKTVNAAVTSLADKTVVVLGAHEEAHKSILNSTFADIVINKDWQKGMGSSLKKGLRHLLETNPTIKSVIVAVCDQPLLDTGHLNKLMAKYHDTKKGIVASHYGKTNGVPVLFDHNYFEKLLNLDDMQGAKKIIQQHPEDVSQIQFPEGEIDLDTMEDYNAFNAL